MHSSFVPPAEPRWPHHAIALCAAIRSDAAPEARARVWALLWNLLRDVLFANLRQEAARFHTASREDLEDLASNKALELLARAERGEWDPTGRSPGEVVEFLRSTARHALGHLARAHARIAHPSQASDDHRVERLSGESTMLTPEHIAESHEFARCLLACVGELQPRARLVWMLRAVYDLGSRDIGAHPSVGASIANVDVMLMRARAHLRTCLARQGFEPEPLPVGSFSLIWERMRHTTPAAGPEASED